MGWLKLEFFCRLWKSQELGARRRKRHQNPINGLNFMREMVKTEKRRKSCAVKRERPCVCMARAVCTLCLFFGTAVHAVRTSVFAFLCFFTHFCFELAFGVSMKVLGNFVSFPMDLVWLENVLWILSYDENTPSGSSRNFKET